MPERKITIKSGKEEISMEVTEEEYRNYYRPWWQQKKREQRNRKTMKEMGYTEESYDGWKDGMLDGQNELVSQEESVEEIIEKQCMLGILEWVKRFEEGSKFGIDGGRISKLMLKENGMVVANYDRGWDIKPTDEESEIALAILMKEYN